MENSLSRPFISDSDITSTICICGANKVYGKHLYEHMFEKVFPSRLFFDERVIGEMVLRPSQQVTGDWPRRRKCAVVIVKSWMWRRALQINWHKLRCEGIRANGTYRNGRRYCKRHAFCYKFHVVFSNNGNGHGVYINNSPLNRIRRI